MTVEILHIFSNTIPTILNNSNCIFPQRLTEYYYVSEQIHELAVRKGISWIAREAKVAGAGWIAAMEPGNIRVISRYKGLGTLRKLAKSPYEVDLYGITLRLITPQRLPANYENLCVLVLFPSDEFVEKCFSIAAGAKMLVIPWSRQDAENWIKRSGAVLYNHPLHRRLAIDSNS